MPRMEEHELGETQPGLAGEPRARRPELRQRYVAARTDGERRVAQLWARVIELDRVGVHDNFFDLGGDSVRLVAVLTALRQHGDTGVTAVDLFRYPTVATLTAHLEQLPTADILPMPDSPSLADSPFLADSPAPTGRDAARSRGQNRRRLMAARQRPPDTAKDGDPR